MDSRANAQFAFVKKKLKQRAHAKSSHHRDGSTQAEFQAISRMKAVGPKTGENQKRDDFCLRRK